MDKNIYFCADNYSYLLHFGEELFCVDNYMDTEEALNKNEPEIVTTSIAHMSFDLIDAGYNIWLCYKENKIKVEPGMDMPTGKDIRMSHNIRKLFLAGCFDELLGINRN